jgi:hypothetical protein
LIITLMITGLATFSIGLVPTSRRSGWPRRSLARRKNQRRRLQQIGSGLDVREASPCEVPLRREQIQHGGQTRGLVGLQGRGVRLAGDHERSSLTRGWGKDASLTVLTPEHYLPLLYVLGATMDGDPVSFPVEGVDGGSVSMLSVQIGYREHR